MGYPRPTLATVPTAPLVGAVAILGVSHVGVLALAFTV